MTNGIFKDNAERDALLVEIRTLLEQLSEDIKRLSNEIKCLSDVTREHDREITQSKAYLGLFSGVFVALFVYLLQRVLR